MKTLTICLLVFAGNIYAGIGAGESAPTPLPIQLISFTAQVQGNIVELKWATATEVSNYGFEILRFAQNDGHSEEESWETIGFVPGHGNTNSPKEYSFTDNIYNGFGYYSYRLKQIDTDGKFSYSNVVTVLVVQIPTSYNLLQNYPNPFNPTTIISYSVPKISGVSLNVFDVLGNLVKTLVNENQKAGSYNVSFDGSELSNGIYFYKFQAGEFVSVKKMLLLK